MSFNGANARRLYESFCAKGAECKGSTGPRGFVRRLFELVGLTEDIHGNPRVDTEKRAMRAKDVSLKELTFAMLGEEAQYKILGPASTDYNQLTEDATSAVHPGDFANISAWNVAVSGLLGAQVMEAYRRPEFIGERLATVRPTKLRQTKKIGIGIVGDLAEDMKPGQRHPRAQLPERYGLSPITKKRGLGIEVTYEAVFFDLTGQVNQQAESIGYELGLRRERMIIDQFLGIAPAAQNWNYGGVAYGTYQTATPYINDHANPLNDWQDVDDARMLFAGMRDMEKGELIAIGGRDVLVMPGKEMEAQMIFSYDRLERSTQSAAEVGIGPNPLRSAGYNLLPTSMLVYDRLIAADGGALDAAVAREYWFMGDFKMAFDYWENWGMRTKRAAANDYDMADQDLILAIFVNEMGIPGVNEPHAIVRNKN